MLPENKKFVTYTVRYVRPFNRAEIANSDHTAISAPHPVSSQDRTSLHKQNIMGSCMECYCDFSS